MKNVPESKPGDLCTALLWNGERERGFQMQEEDERGWTYDYHEVVKC